AGRKIVSIPYLSQALVAIVLQRPDDARARPTSAAERFYNNLYSEDYPRQMYAKCALILKRIDEYLDEIDADRTSKLNILFGLAMYATCAVAKSAKPRRTTIADMDISKFSDDVLEKCYDKVLAIYTELGGD